MRDRLLLATYLAGVLVVTMVHDLRIIGVIGLLCLALCGRRAVSLAARAITAVAWFVGIVTVSYVVWFTPRGDVSWNYVLLVNVRVFVMILGALLLQRHCNVIRAVSFSPLWSRVLVIAYSQVVTLRRVLDDFVNALRSRTVRRRSLREIYRHRGVVGAVLFGRSLRAAEEVSHAMESRGGFNDPR